jgi:hypothetical protein
LAIYDRTLTEEQVLKNFEEWDKNKKSPLPKEEGLSMTSMEGLMDILILDRHGYSCEMLGMGGEACS